MKLFSLVLVLALGACRHSEENLGLGSRPAALPALTGLGEPGRLEAVLAASPLAVEQKLGPHSRQQTVKLVLGSGERSESFEEFWRTEMDDRGSLHALHDTSRDEGIEWYAVGGLLYVRPRHGQFVKHRPEGDELARARGEQAGVLAGYLEVLGRFAARTESQIEHGGRKAIRVELGRAAEPTPLRDEEPGHAWRRSLRVEALAGEVILDAASGAPLKARLEARYAFTRGPGGAWAGEGRGHGDGTAPPREVTVALAYRSETRVGAAAAPIAAPEGAITLGRPRPLLERAALLEGLGTNQR